MDDKFITFAGVHKSVKFSHYGFLFGIDA